MQETQKTGDGKRDEGGDKVLVYAVMPQLKKALQIPVCVCVYIKYPHRRRCEGYPSK